ncbi:MAG: alpha/beta hydrolase [Betaproteobacteria bacterium]|nr:alpha/beta hydrolase [Betaproteobacteria bacterium]MDE2048586.1 alpha/beta hydrolase [Betaproteobacteria bacterium]
MYQPRRTSTSAFVRIRGLDYHLRIWGERSRAPLVMVHGWMDVGASFQFVVDALDDAFFASHCVIAPDWRGYGLSARTAADCYWFADYLGDLDAIADHVSPSAPFDLLGHSMGGNVVMTYAGVRPQRVRSLINLEGFGLPQTVPAQAPARYAQWLDALKAGASMRPYGSLQAVAERLMANNPRLAADRAHWLAQHWAAPDGQGGYAVRGDPAHKLPTPMLYRVDEVLACWQRIGAPVLAVEGTATDVAKYWGSRYTLDEYHQRLACVPHCTVRQIDGAGHMLHHEQPEQLAALVAQHVRGAAGI